MHDRRLVAGGAAFALVMVAAIALLFIAPRVAASGLTGLVQQQLGRGVSVKGGIHLDFSPLSLRLEDVALAGADARDDSFVMARSAVVPVSVGQLFGAAPRLAEIAVAEPDIALIVNERGEASWDFPDAAPGGPLRIAVEQGRFRYFDARNNQSMELSRVDGRLDLRADGGVSFAGTAVINGRLVRIDADLKSLARVNADGSPLELALVADDGNASFSGRLSTAKVMSLAGPVSLASTTPGPGLRLLGLPVPDGAVVVGPIAIDGALDSAGRAFAIRNATLGIGALRAAGELGADLRNDHPKLQAKLVADTLWLDPLLPAAGAKDGEWGRLPLPFALLRTIDLETAIDARSLSYGGFTAGASRLSATLAGGKLELSGGARLAGDGTLTFTLTADATSLPPAVGLDIAASDTEVQPLLAALVGVNQLSGKGSFAAKLTAAGTTQEELAGMLKGTASITLGEGRIEGADFTGLMLAARQNTLEGWSDAPGGTPFTSLSGEATIADGIASFRGVEIAGPVTSFTLEGLIDVLRKGIAVSVTGMSNGQPLLPVAVIAKGLWARPKIFADVPSIITTPEGGIPGMQDAAPAQGN